MCVNVVWSWCLCTTLNEMGLVLLNESNGVLSRSCHRKSLQHCVLFVCGVCGVDGRGGVFGVRCSVVVCAREKMVLPSSPTIGCCCIFSSVWEVVLSSLPPLGGCFSPHIIIVIVTCLRKYLFDTYTKGRGGTRYHPKRKKATPPERHPTRERSEGSATLKKKGDRSTTQKKERRKSTTTHKRKAQKATPLYRKRRRQHHPRAESSIPSTTTPQKKVRDTTPS